ncbi:hypothetical protein BBJ41_01105 [Burkholderia stabilis]|uniref:ankyrin repeat domain-containing protein n=1 Tax=Burkholderia stabilis TaxID=95485 RepID=UPI000851A37B|nr:ankyrin repeat domain-containing protein [Burkholderia stabilis]AOR66263.1 hypothetical protein BBJ41_01105 [Burkholderia stabilis]HDR9491928.1 ankyrin repeat domain-containing protein [Burkholderia stabilis]HDR9524038.1 ankyrin repeat domain-containing protein [Burkholderia stabilis]HDR9530655.1 ankyrin repeat domain-containing protein [Burkholderia stabilis]HDR9539385.1 ankyrin repeat domain-containing protein [Burkholderia stabilis]
MTYDVLHDLDHDHPLTLLAKGDGSMTSLAWEVLIVGIDLNRAIVEAHTPLIGVAIGPEGNLDAALAMIEAGASVNVALRYAHDRRRVELLLRLGANPQQVVDGGTLLHVRCGSAEADLDDTIGAVEALLDAGLDVNARDGNGWTPLLSALYQNTTVDVMPLVARLVKRGADLNARTDDDESALLVAATSGQVNATGYLLSRGADPAHALHHPGWANPAEDHAELVREAMHLVELAYERQVLAGAAGDPPAGAEPSARRRL